MIVFVDTNVLISSLLNINSIPFKAIAKADDYPFFCITSDYCLEELNSVIHKKFPKYLNLMDRHLAIIIRMINIIYTSKDSVIEELLIRDIKDRLVLRAALQINADLLITGDKDLLELPITKPKIITPREFLDNY